MFAEVMSDPEICKEVLEVLLGEKIGQLERVENEKTLQFTADGKPIRMDILTEDEENRAYYDAEMQNKNRHGLESLALGRRSRLYQAIIDSITTEKGSHFRDMYDMNVLFICTFDPFGKGLGVYTFSERCDEMPELTLDDGVRKIFYNTTAADTGYNENIRKLFGYIETGKAGDELTKRIDEKIISIRGREDLEMGYWSYKADIEDAVFFGHEEGYAEGKAEGEAKGKAEGKAEGRDDVLCSLYIDGTLSLKDAADRADCSPEEFLQKCRERGWQG